MSMDIEQALFEGIPVSFELATTNENAEVDTQTIFVLVDGKATVDGKSIDVLPIDAMKLVHTVASNFRKPQMLDDYLFDDNLDGWAITITNDDNQSWIFEGDYGEALLVGQHNLSDLIRTTLQKDVWAFDGNTQDIKITKVVLSYFGDNPDDHTDKIVVQREPESIELDKLLNNGTHVAQQVAFNTRQEVTSALASLEQSEFFQNIHKQEMTLVDRFKKHKKLTSYFYKLDITYADNTELTYTDSFRNIDMPAGLGSFVFEINQILMDSVGGALLAPFNREHTYGETQGYIFCSVSFSGSDKTYYYLTDDKSIKVGDQVVVPVGEYGSLKIVDVEHVETFSAKDAPMAVNKVKKVVQKVEK